MNHIESEKKYDDDQIIRIYKIVSSALNEWCYVGSTKQSLNDRWSDHRCHFRNWYNGDKKRVISWFKYAVEIGDLELNTFQIELVKEVQVSSQEERLKIEGQYILELNACNRCLAGRTREEYYDENFDKIAEYQKEYRENHKAEMQAYKKEYYTTNKADIQEKYKEYRETHKEEIREKKKKYREGEHREKLLEKKKRDYQKNRERLLEKHDCPCGGRYSTMSKLIHERTKMHQKYLEQNQ